MMGLRPLVAGIANCTSWICWIVTVLVLNSSRPPQLVVSLRLSKQNRPYPLNVTLGFTLHQESSGQVWSPNRSSLLFWPPQVGTLAEVVEELNRHGPSWPGVFDINRSAFAA